jgi:hypothetical protein
LPATRRRRCTCQLHEMQPRPPIMTPAEMMGPGRRPQTGRSATRKRLWSQWLQFRLCHSPLLEAPRRLDSAPGAACARCQWTVGVPFYLRPPRSGRAASVPTLTRRGVQPQGAHSCPENGRPPGGCRSLQGPRICDPRGVGTADVPRPLLVPARKLRVDFALPRAVPLALLARGHPGDATFHKSEATFSRGCILLYTT